ncbi:MAG: putative porin [Mucilaginibacter polytrichastri]|nr:putative porin [Mucilaginibacter polytrichastri]
MLAATGAYAQIPTQPAYPGQRTNTSPFQDTTRRDRENPGEDEEMDIDSMRKRAEGNRDSVIFTAKFIRYTNLKLLSDSTQTLPLDTGLSNFENYNVLYQPERPTLGIGNLGLAARDLLFSPPKTLGYDVGLHGLDYYLLRPEDVQYYRARSPYTRLYYISGGQQEQVFQATHSQNIRPNWNFGAHYFRMTNEGFYGRQLANHLNAAIFSWYESPNKRYNILGNLFFNNLRAQENGSITNDGIFVQENSSLSKEREPVRLTAANNALTNWRDNGLFLRQFYYIGRIDSINNDSSTTSKKILPTQRISHTFQYNQRKYRYLQATPDGYNVFANSYGDPEMSRDSFRVFNVRNEFTYSFYLRPRTVRFVKNEAKIDLGLQHDYYRIQQIIQDVDSSAATRQVYRRTMYSDNFQNVTLKARAGYRFSDRVTLGLDLQQVAQGYNFGDYLYQANANFLIGNKLGRIILEAYSQNNRPAQLYDRWSWSHFRWDTDFPKQKINAFTFTYENAPLRIRAKAEYFLVNNYLYLQADSLPNDPVPQMAGSINVLKLSLRKDFTFFRRVHFDNYAVYQLTDSRDLLRTPEIYTFSSLYFTPPKLFKVLWLNAGVNVRFNTSHQAPFYAPGIGQFYNGSDILFSSYPIADVFLKANLKRVNLLLKYDYANQGLFQKGYYTVNRYPMPDALFKFGVSWNFYD